MAAGPAQCALYPMARTDSAVFQGIYIPQKRSWSGMNRTYALGQNIPHQKPLCGFGTQNLDGQRYIHSSHNMDGNIVAVIFGTRGLDTLPVTQTPRRCENCPLSQR